MAASNYPAGYDDLIDPTGADPLDSLTVPHDTQHANANTGLEAVQHVLGLNPQGLHSTVRARLDGIGYASMTSDTSLAIGTGAQVFTVNNVGWYVVGTRVRVVSQATPANFVEGDITDITGLVVTVDVDYVEGAGTFDDWQFTTSGVRGATGDPGEPGADGADGVVPLSDADPLAVAAVADPGVSTDASRADHVHVGGSGDSSGYSRTFMMMGA